MTDLESRLGAALRVAGDAAPHAGGLADGARARLRRRRRTTLAGVAVAVVVAVAAPLGLRAGLTGGDPEVTTAVPDGWRTESFRDLTLRVPDDWGFQGGPDWCLGDGSPAVTRTEGWVTNAACTPRFTYGVQFRDVPPGLFPEPKRVPDDAVLELVGTASASAWIVAESEQQLTTIVESVEQIDGVDANGCPPVLGPNLEATGERVSVCRYDSGELEQSELLSVEDSAEAARAVSAAPVDMGGLVVCGEYSRRQPLITLRSATVDANLLPSTGCALATRFVDGTQVRLVTDDVLYWALSPGWQGSDSRLPVPDPLRD